MRPRRRLSAACALLVAAVAVLVSSPGAAAARRAPTGPTLFETDQWYGRSARQVVTMIRPAGPYANRRTVVFIHGGGWTGGTRASWDAEARAWASRGWVTINMEYRVATFDGRPGDGLDAAEDVLAVYEKYAPLALTGKFVLVGDSAGGQLATAVGGQLGRTKVAGVVAWSPIANPRDLADRAGDPGRTHLQRALGHKAQEFWSFDYDAWSAYRYVEAGTAPPMYVVGGARESYVVWNEQGRTLCRTKGFRGVCVAVRSKLHGRNLWTTAEGERQRIAARAWAEAETR
jgi:acetyl esterase/lipase